MTRKRPAPPARYELVTRAGCHLCDEMAALLDEVLPAHGLTWTPLDGQPHTYTLDDPYTAQSYKPQPLGQFANIIPRTAPPITLKGGGAYRDSLSEELQKVLTDQQTPEQAAAALAGRWDAITEEQGIDIQLEALQTLNASFPTVVDTPGVQLPVTEISTEVAA